MGVLASADCAKLLSKTYGFYEYLNFSKIVNRLGLLALIDDCAKDGREEFFTEMHCVL